MKRWMTRLGAVAVIVVPLAVGAAGEAGAAGATGAGATWVGNGPTTAAVDGRTFGHHVAACAQTMGLSGDHNPGMHRGITGWMTNHTMCEQTM